ncbi:MAG: SPOR domain-containing protein, partial [Pseudomonadota bacterium]
QTDDRLDRPFIQVGVFTAQDNANTAADQLRGAGIVPTTVNETGNNGPYWRLTVGPAQNSQERAALLDSVRGLGFEDAYFVSN